MSKIEARPERIRLVAQVAGWIGIATLILLDILKTPFYADDEPNSQILAVLKYNHESIWHYVDRMVRQWMDNEGRFFPLSAFEAVHVFSIFHDRLMYKSAQIGVVLLCSLLVGLAIRQITNDRGLAIFGAGIMIAVIQIRAWYDPTIAFSLLVPSVTIKVLISINCLIAAVKMHKAWSRFLTILLGFLSWTYAIFQYEVSLFLFPAVLVVIWTCTHGTRRYRQVTTALMSLPVAMMVVVAVHLRSHVIVSSGYKINTDPALVGMTYLRQLFSSVPFSYAASAQGTFLPSVGILVIAFSTVAAALLSVGLWSGGANPISKRPLLWLGLTFLLGAPLSTSISSRWQLEITWGLGYLVVFIEYVGITFLLIFAVSFIREKEMTVTKIVSSGLVTALCALLIVGTSTSNREVAHRLEPIAIKRGLFEDSVRDGLFAEVNQNATIISPSTNQNGWVNPWYYQWLGGSETHTFSNVQFGMVVACTEAQKVGQCNLRGPWWGLVEIPFGERNSVVVLGKYARLDIDHLTTELVPGSIRLEVRDIAQLPNQCKVKIRGTTRKHWIASCDSTVTSFQQITNLLNAMS